MLKVIGLLWRTLLAVGGLIGLLYLGPDWAGRQAALDWWESKSPMSAFTFVIVVYALAVIWIAELELRRALASPHWPTFRDSLRRGLGVIFKRDLRVAELQNISDDAELLRLRQEAAMQAQGVQTEKDALFKELREYLLMLSAEHKLETFDLVCQPCEAPQPPRPTGDDDLDRSAWGQFNEGMGERRRTIFNQAGMNDLDVLNRGAWERIQGAGNRVRPRQFRPEEEGVDWPNGAMRMAWLAFAAEIDQYKKEREAAKRHLQQWATELSRAKKVEEILRRLPPDIEAEKPQ